MASPKEQKTEYAVVNKFFGFQAKQDITNLPPGVLVAGSQNVLINDGERVAIRQGYTLDGQSNDALHPIVSAFDWETHFNTERHLRSYYDELEYRYVADDGTVTWNRLKNGWGDDVHFQYTDWWDNTEQSSELLFVNGDLNIYEWSGGITTFASASDTAIKIVGNNVLLTATGLVTTSPRFTIYRNGLVGTSFQASVVFDSQPNDGDVLILNYNGGGAQVQFVSTIGAVAGNVLIGATLADTITNLLGLLTAPGTTNATQVQFSAPNITAVGYTTSTSTTTLTKQGTTTWAEEGFFTSGTRKVVINGVEYTYTGGEGTLTLTGVSPDASLAGITAGTLIVQAVRAFANSGATGLPTGSAWSNDLISVLYNQIYLGCLNNRQVYVSKVNSLTDFSFSSPRTPGQGALLTLDGNAVGFVPQENVMEITAGKNQWYVTQFQLSSDNTKETLNVQRLKTTGQAAAQSQNLIAKIKNYVFFVSNEPSLDTLGKIELIDTPQSTNISDPIKNLFNATDFEGGFCYYHRNYIYLSAPNDGLVLMFSMARALLASASDVAVSINAAGSLVGWEAPQILPISCFSTIDGELYGHSSQTPETFKMFTGYNDDGNPIDARALFSYQQFGDRANTKNCNEFYNEGYITSNTELMLALYYNYQGCEGSVTKTISGSDPRTVCTPGGDGSLGKQSLGIRSLAGRGATADDLPPKFRIIKTFPKTDFYELQVGFSSNDVDQHWELLAWGPNVMMSTSTNANIKE